MKNKLVRYLIIMFIFFVIDSILRFYLPSSILKLNLTIVPYVGVMMFDLLTNTIDEDHRYIFAGICGIYFSVIYGNSIFVYVLLFFMYSFFEKRYMKKAVMTYFEAIVIVVLTIFVQESVLYSLMWITNTTQLVITTFLIKRLLPTLLFNIVIFNGVYFIHDKLKLEGVLMYILVKNLNGRLIFIMDNEVDFEVLLNELKGLLVQSFFKKKDYYPKAFFDLKGRILENDEILQFFGVLVECKSLLFGGFIEEKTEEKKELRMIDASIHAGEKIEIYEDTLITGKINPGAIVQVYAKLYVMQGVFGIIEVQSEEACISSQRFKNATIRFFGKSIHHFTTFEMSLVYYKDNDIVVEKGDYIHV